MRISKVVVAVAALLSCSVASAQSTKYYMRQYVAKKAATANDPKDTSCGSLADSTWITKAVGPSQRLVGQGSGIVGEAAARSWCNSNKPFGMVGACLYQASGGVGIVSLYEGYSVGFVTGAGYNYGANCS